jgi:hypothetical protein
MPTAITGGTQSLPEGASLSRSSHSPAMSDSGISVDAASNNSGSSAPMLGTIVALAQMGSVRILINHFYILCMKYFVGVPKHV